MQILLSGGLGDCFALCSMMNDHERQALTKIVWAAKVAPLLIPMFEACPRFQHVTHEVLPLKPGHVYFTVQGAREDFPHLPYDLQDWGVMARFAEFDRRPYTRSEFLQGHPASLDHLGELPDRYVVIQHQTPTHTGPEQRALRDLDPSEWERIIQRLEAEDLHAVVVNSADADAPPRHPRVIDLVGKTTLPESIALMRRAQGFWGLASSLVVLAAQLFGPDQLWVKGPEAWIWFHRHIYLAPHTEFRFVYRHLCWESPRSAIDKGMVTVRMNVARMVQGNYLGVGALVEMSPDVAEGFIRTGQAQLWDSIPKYEAEKKPDQLKESINKKIHRRMKAARFEE